MPFDFRYKNGMINEVHLPIYRTYRVWITNYYKYNKCTADSTSEDLCIGYEKG